MNIKNIFLISMDEVRPDYLSIFKKTKNTLYTPALENILKNGIAFNNCIISNVGTPGSHACMITGAYPFHNGVRNNFAQGMSDKVKTIQERLKFNDWLTSTFVNHKHLTHLNFDRGSDSFFFHPTVRGTGTDIHPCTDWFTPAHETTTRVINHFDMLNSIEPEKNKFFFIHYLDAHLDLGDIENYKKNITLVDSQIGRLYNHIEQIGEINETLFVILSDHGEGQPGDSRYELTGGVGLEVFDTSIKTPLLISHPEFKEKNIVYDDVQVRTIDVVPTILDLCGIRSAAIVGDNIDGESLSFYTGFTIIKPKTEIAYCEAFSPGFFMRSWGTTQYELTFKVHDWVCIRYDNSWKVCYNADNNKLEPLEVYDLIFDPEERNNKIDDIIAHQLIISQSNEIINKLIPKKQEDVSQLVTEQMLVDSGKFSYEKNKHRTGMYRKKEDGGLL